MHQLEIASSKAQSHTLESESQLSDTFCFFPWLLRAPPGQAREGSDWSQDVTEMAARTNRTAHFEGVHGDSFRKNTLSY